MKIWVTKSVIFFEQIYEKIGKSLMDWIGKGEMALYLAVQRQLNNR